MTTTKNSMTFVQMIGKMLAEGNGDFLHDAISSLLREVMAVEVGQSEEALLNVIQEAYVKGASTRKVEDS